MHWAGTMVESLFSKFQPRGESQSTGCCEQAVHVVTEFIRVLKGQVEQKAKVKLNLGMNRAQRCDGQNRHQSESGLGCIIMRTTCGHFGTSVVPHET